MSSDATIVLAIIAKIPRERQCKTRLVPALSHAQAAAISRAFLADTADNVRAAAARCGASAAVLSTGIATDAERAELFGAAVPYIEQRGDGFGERIASGIADFFKAGHSGVVILDSDSPTLPTRCLEATCRALQAPGDRVVLGPAIDGGYYLIGLKGLHPELFKGIAWSTERVFAQTAARAQSLGLDIVTLEPWYDVDDAISLDMLRREFERGLPAGGFYARRTRTFVANHDFAERKELFV